MSGGKHRPENVLARQHEGASEDYARELATINNERADTEEFPRISGEIEL